MEAKRRAAKCVAWSIAFSRHACPPEHPGLRHATVTVWLVQSPTKHCCTSVAKAFVLLLIWSSGRFLHTVMRSKSSLNAYSWASDSKSKCLTTMDWKTLRMDWVSALQ